MMLLAIITMVTLFIRVCYLCYSGLLEKKGDYYQVTKKGREQFMLISTLNM